MTFHVGQRVVCVNDKPWPGYNPTWDAPIFAGRIYTIASLVALASGRQGCHLTEVTRPSCTPFALVRFRPLVTKSTETGMAILRRALEPNQMEVV